MNEKPTPPKKDIYSYLALLLCFALFVAGVCGIVSSRTASHEYKNSDDVREVSAVVQDYEPIAIRTPTATRPIGSTRPSCHLTSMERPTPERILSTEI